MNFRDQKMNRLVYLILSVSLAWTLSAQQIYVGTHSKNESKGLYSSQLNQDGTLKETKGLLLELGTTVVIQKKGSSLIYSCGVGEKKQHGLIQCFDTQTGKLIDTVSSSDSRPCYLALSKDQSTIYVSNIKDGSVCAISLKKDGSFAELISKVIIEPAGKRFAPHACVVSPEGEYLFVPDIAGNRLCRLKIDQVSGKLKYLDSIQSELFQGPRHMTFDPEGKRAYMVNQMGEAITVFTYGKGILKILGNVRTVPDDQLDINNHIAEIKLHPSGKYVYASNRGHNSLVLFQRDLATGLLNFDRCFSSGGEAPWSFAISAKGDFLYCSNNKSNNLVTYKIDPANGHLKPIGKPVSVPNPASVIVVD